MKQNSTKTQDDEINLKETIKILWQKKILIFFISLIFTVGGYMYGVLQPKMYKSEIIIAEAPKDLFDNYNDFFTGIGLDISKDFNDEIKLNLLSRDNLIEFYESYDKITDFKNHLKEKNISAISYFNEDSKNVITEKKNFQNKYSFTFSEHLPGQSFLDDYVLFTQQKILAVYKKRLVQKILYHISVIKINFEIAKTINVVEPITLKEPLYIFNKSESNLFYNGTKVLSLQLTYLNDLIKTTENSKFDYNPILQKSSKGLPMYNNPILFASMGFLLGFFFLFIIFFVKKIFEQ